MNEPILVVTSVEALGRPIRAVKGLVAGQAVVGVEILEHEAAEKPEGGRRVGYYERAFVSARDAALANLLADARRLGANAVVDARLQYGEVEPTMDPAVFASFTATAVVV